MPGVGATGATERVSMVKETTWGVTPATPAFQNVRFTSESLVGEKQTVRSNEVRPDRNVTDEILTALMGSGNLEVEMSYGTFDDVLAALLFSDWSSDTLINGTTPASYTIEKTLTASDQSKVYQRFAGAMFNTLSLNLQSGQLITGSIGVMAKGVTVDPAIVTGATYASAGTSEVMSSGAHAANIVTTGLATAPIVESMTIDITNNLRQRMAVGSLGSVGIGEGRFEVSGTMNAYFQDKNLLQAFLNHDAFGLQFTLGKAGAKYRITLPKIKLSAGSLNGGGNDADSMLNVNYTALLDTTVGGTLKIERNVA